MKMLKTIGLSIMLLFTASVQASDKPVLDVIIPSGNGGNAWAEGNLLRDALVKLGYDSEVVWTKNCANTVDYMKKDTGRPGIFIHGSGRYISDKAKGCNLVADKSTFVYPLYLRLQTMCVRKDSGFTSIQDFLQGKDRVTIATTNTLPQGIYDDLSESTGVRFVRVDYDGSKRILKGLIAGDTDLMYSGYTKSEQKATEISCFTTSAAKEINGLPPMKDLFPGWGLNALSTYKYIHAVNLPASRMQEVRNAMAAVIDKDEKVAPYIRNASMVPGTEITDGALENFLKTVDQWKGESR